MDGVADSILVTWAVGVKPTGGELIPLAEAARRVRDGLGKTTKGATIAEAMAEQRTLADAEAVATGADRRKLHKQRGDHKTTLPTFIPAVEVDWQGHKTPTDTCARERCTGRALQHVVRYTGLVVVDLDGLEDLAGALAPMRDLQGLRLLYTSPSGRGLKAWVAVDPIPSTVAEYKDVWEQLTRQVEASTGCKVDESGSDPTRLSFTAHDPAVLVGEAAPLEWTHSSGAAAPRPSPPRPAVSSDPLDVALSALAAIPLGAGEHDKRVRVGQALHSEFGDAAQAAFLSWAAQNPDYDEAKVKRDWRGYKAGGGLTIATLYQMAQDAGWENPNHAAPQGGRGVRRAAVKLAQGAAFWGEFDTGPLRDSWRLIQDHAPQLLVVSSEGYFDRLLWTDPDTSDGPGTGVWREDVAHLHRMVQKSLDAMLQKAWAKLEGEPLAAVEKYERSSRRHAHWGAVLDTVGNAVGYFDRTGTTPLGLLRCQDTDLDADMRYMGAPNGVIDLATGLLLTGHAARSKLVTRRVADPYNPDEPEAEALRLFQHLPKEERDWLLNAIGFGMWGNPSRRIYPVVGVPGGGKTTALKAVIAALGDYGYDIPTGAFDQQRAESMARDGGTVRFTQTRVGALSETDPQQPLNHNLILNVAGGDPLPARRMRENIDDRPVGVSTCTVFWAVNGERYPRFDWSNPAEQERLFELGYPMLPEEARDPNFNRTAAAPGPLRRSLLTLLVRRAGKNRHAPPR